MSSEMDEWVGDRQTDREMGAYREIWKEDIDCGLTGMYGHRALNQPFLPPISASFCLALSPTALPEPHKYGWGCATYPVHQEEPQIQDGGY